ncbi:MAG: 30S ribosomal protein S9 [Candidatus Diapherotrites archaeon]|nr:30S ribosomal protein S9 [Candidatus Diapherotrites archaeon]
MTVKAKKKTARARALVKTGKGRISINQKSLTIIEPRYVKMLIEEPLILAPEDLVSSIDIRVSVMGGGFSGQAGAVRSAIAKALISYTGDEKLRDRFLEYDRTLLVDDVRRKEAKKPLGKGARKKKQKSKR